jgi:hypothetical protein
MIGRICTLLAAALLFVLLTASSAAAFGLKHFDVRIVDKHGEPAMQAGTHPFALETEFELETEHTAEFGELPAGQLKETTGQLPTGLTGSPYAVPQCEGVAFATIVEEGGIERPDCPDSSVVGLVKISAALGDGTPVKLDTPLYNLVPPPGVAAKLGFLPYHASPLTIDVGIKDHPPYNAVIAAVNVTQTARVLGFTATVWGDPSSESHDEERGSCGLFLELKIPLEVEGPPCKTSNPDTPFLTMPRSCEGPLLFSFDALSWTGESSHVSVLTHDNSVPPVPLGVGRCDQVSFTPAIGSLPTTTQASAPSGLDFGLDLDNPGLTNPEGTSRSDLKKAVVTLPKGMTINPSQAEGLAVCSIAQFEAETAQSQFGAGCPVAAKIGTTEVETPLLGNKTLKGSLFVAKPFANPFGTLIALYMTFKEPQLGIGIRVAGKVEPDPRTGQLIATFDDLPQQPFSHFRLRFREGGRSPLITPPTCGTYTTKAIFTPWANPQAPVEVSAPFQIASGVGGGPCPAGSTPPFQPGFLAGTASNQAGSYSPFYTRITRRDGDQDLTRFSATLPAGLAARLAGVARCPDSQIVQAKAKTGLAELASPSCPLDSLIGTLQAGAGVGSQLTYVSGRVYLAGPYNGAPLSVVEIVPAVAGPFDVGTVVVRQALAINPRSAEVTVDGARSDPIPHILAGIPLSVRDIRVNVDRSGFTFNPTSCEPSQVAATLWGGGADPFSSADDSPLSLGAHFQAAGCQSLAFKPSLALKLKGGTLRGAFPKLHLTYRPRPGDANLKRLVLRLPHSEFIEQGHFRTICTRVQFAAGQGFGASCPKGSVYGRAKVFTPVLDQPFEGPVFLRSSNHNLPDVVLALHGPPGLDVQVEVPAKIDSLKGGLRATVEAAPDVPVSKAIVDMQGGQKGLFVNSTDLCARPHRARVQLGAHNAKTASLRPLVRAQCAHRGR